LVKHAQPARAEPLTQRQRIHGCNSSLRHLPLCNSILHLCCQVLPLAISSPLFPPASSTPPPLLVQLLTWRAPRCGPPSPPGCASGSARGA
jgi:hypothetical protein